MKCPLLFCLAILIFCQTAHAQPKKYVPIVKPVLYEKTKESFESIARKFEDANYKDLGEIFRSFANGGHGSGFVFVDADGENYVITNKHVVANSETVTLEFIEKGTSKIVHEACPIIYTDDNIDLAVIKFPNNEKVYDKSFRIETGKQSEGIEIWSAGYPGLMGKPMWQFSKGNITNEEAYIDELMSADISYLIQHSASIDPGNSGGPLLLKDKNNDEYSIIGINTWTVSNRQNTFFSLPASNIPSLIEKAKKIISLKNNSDSLRILLEKQCNIFASEMNSDNPQWSKIDHNISYLYVAEKGWDSFLKIVNERSSENNKLLEKRFFNYSPIEAMRLAILIRMWEKWDYLKKEKITISFEGINLADKDQVVPGKTVRTNYLINGKPHELVWFFEHGHWRISNYDLEKSYGSKNENRPGNKNSDTQSNFFVGLDLNFVPMTFFKNETLKNNFNLMGYGGTLTFNFGERGGIYTRISSLSLNNKMKSVPADLNSASIKYFHFNGGLLIYFTKSRVKPYMLGGFNYFKFYETGTTENASITQEFSRLGAQLGFGTKIKIKGNLSVFAEGTYNSSSIIPFLEYDDETSPNLTNMNINVGLSIDFKKSASKK